MLIFSIASTPSSTSRLQLGPSFAQTLQTEDPAMSYHSQPSSQKTRHYANLASKLQKLQTELKVTEGYMEKMSKQLDGMSKFGAYSGAQ
jgi:folate-dependent phosphoribosylglycinamide formyltransferase PurN